MTPPAGRTGATVPDLGNQAAAATAATVRHAGLRGRGRWLPPARSRPEDPMGVLTDARKQHLYQACQDEGCQRFACRVYKEGYRNGKEDGKAEGYARGRADGYDEGFAAGYSAGYSAGAASCGDG